MLLAKVIGTATCTLKLNIIDRAKLKIVKFIKPNGKSIEYFSIVEDAIGVGVGEKVLIAEDEISIAKVLNTKNNVPIRYCIVAKVDFVNIVIK